MVKSSVASFIMRIYRKRQKVSVVNLFHKFGQDNDADILDYIEQSLLNPTTFSLRKKTNETSESEVTTDETKKISLVSILGKENVSIGIGGESVNAYKYLFFTVKYGENGDRSLVERPDGTEIQVTSEDYLHREYHVFIAFANDSEAEYGAILVESRGAHSIQTPLASVLKNTVVNIENENYSMEITHFVDTNVIKNYINQGKVTHLRLIKNVDSQEHGAPMQYDTEEITFSRPRGEGLTRFIRHIYANKFTKQTRSGIKKIDDFDADSVKFKVTTESGVKTYTSGNVQTGLIQEVMPEGIVGADGRTVSNSILIEMKRIFETQHLPR